MPTRDISSRSQGLSHDSVPNKLYQDVVDLNRDRSASSRRTQNLHVAVPAPNRDSTIPGFTRPQAKTLQRAKLPKGPFPPPRGSSLPSHSDAHASNPITAGNTSRTLPVGPPVDGVDSHTRSNYVRKKGHSRSGGCKASKAMRGLGDRLWSNAFIGAPGLSGGFEIVYPRK
jgi:hypothetical protein